MNLASAKTAKKTTVKKTGRRSLRTGLWVFLAVLVVAAAGGAGWYYLAGPGSPAAQASSAKSGPDYHTATVRRGNLLISAAGSGTLVAGTSIDLAFSTRGQVIELNVKAGDHVTTGQELAKLGNIETLQANLASAQLKLLQDQKALTDLQQNANVALATAYQNFLKAQDALTTAQTAAQRSAGPRCASTTIAKLTDTYNQYAQRLADLSISNKGTDAWVLVKGQTDTALANLNYCTSYTDSEKSSLQASLQVAQNNLQLADATYKTLKDASGIDPNALALAQANVTSAQTQVDQAKKDLTGSTLIAPFDGTVLSVAAQKGAIVDTSTFITVADLSKPTVSISIDETDLAKFTIGSKATAVFDALPSQTFNGKVVQVNPQLTSSGQYKVVTGQIVLDDAAAKALNGLPVGLNATIQIINQQASNALLVPVSSLRDLGSKNYAVFVVKNAKLVLTPVKVGLMDTAQAEITSGLKEGDVVSTGIIQGTGN